MSEKQDIITITGVPGSGKSTAAKLILGKLGEDWRYYSAGDRFREMSAGIGLDLAQGNELAKREAWIDEALDREVEFIGSNENHRVVDARLGWNFIPRSFKVYLDLDFPTAALRIIAKKSADAAKRHTTEYVPDDPKEYAKILKKRAKDEKARYKKTYGINISRSKNYDLIINTKEHDPETIAQLVVNGFRRWHES